MRWIERLTFCQIHFWENHRTWGTEDETAGAVLAAYKGELLTFSSCLLGEHNHRSFERNFVNWMAQRRGPKPALKIIGNLPADMNFFYCLVANVEQERGMTTTRGVPRDPREGIRHLEFCFPVECVRPWPDGEWHGGEESFVGYDFVRVIRGLSSLRVSRGQNVTPDRNYGNIFEPLFNEIAAGRGPLTLDLECPEVYGEDGTHEFWVDVYNAMATEQCKVRVLRSRHSGREDECFRYLQVLIRDNKSLRALHLLTEDLTAYEDLAWFDNVLSECVIGQQNIRELK